MRSLLVSLLALALSAPALAASGSPGYPLAPRVEFLLNRAAPQAMQITQLGTQVTLKKVQVMRGVYDFATEGGSVATVTLKDSDKKDAVLPAGAIIKKVIIHTVTAAASGGSATLAFGAASTTDLKGATAKTSFTLNALLDGVPDGTAANAIRLASQTALTATVGTAALTAGKIEVFVEYYLGQ